ncbi:hypothetical protein EVAR_95222_1 [Eumeta japonica]|uniref:Uncharacterized protein n=1 Tax=Eumeta variegata TaxID=151549 RepID=A0A4C2A676_EUMVA|nr:hypothetical protein EVAR_95222_1 [Eumeta japonica]
MIEIYDYDNEVTTQSDIYDSLSDMYELLQEEDMVWSVVETRAIRNEYRYAFEQQGFFEQAQLGWLTCTAATCAFARAENNSSEVLSATPSRPVSQGGVAYPRRVTRPPAAAESGSTTHGT